MARALELPIDLDDVVLVRESEKAYCKRVENVNIECEVVDLVRRVVSLEVGGELNHQNDNRNQNNSKNSKGEVSVSMEIFDQRKRKEDDRSKCDRKQSLELVGVHQGPV